MTLRTVPVALVLLPLSLAACTADPSQAETEVTATLDAFYDAIRSGDTTAAMAVIAEDALFVEGGRLETRAEYESNHLPADIAFEKQVAGRRGSRRVTILDDTAWVIATTEYEGTFEGTPVDFVSAQLAVLTRDSGAWRIRSIHWSSRPR